MTHYVREIKKFIIRACFGTGEYYSATRSVPLAIGLFGDEKEGAIASLSFVHENTRNVKDSYGPVAATGAGDSTVACSLPADEYPKILDLLRKKESLFFHFDSESAYVWITTSEDPVGMHEVLPGMINRGTTRKKRKVHTV